jgi:hypothetical protein
MCSVNFIRTKVIKILQVEKEKYVFIGIVDDAKRMYFYC